MTALRRTEYRHYGCNSCNHTGNSVLHWDNWMWAAWLAMAEKLAACQWQSDSVRLGGPALMWLGVTLDLTSSVWLCEGGKRSFKQSAWCATNCVKGKVSKRTAVNTFSPNSKILKLEEGEAGSKCLQDATIGWFGSVSLSCQSSATPLHQWEYVWGRGSGHVPALHVNMLFWKKWNIPFFFFFNLLFFHFWNTILTLVLPQRGVVELELNFR